MNCRMSRYACKMRSKPVPWKVLNSLEAFCKIAGRLFEITIQPCAGVVFWRVIR